MADPSSRYARQQQYPPIGAQGQQLIRQSEVAVLGCGALGTVAAELLCRAGVGRIRVIDRDIVEWTNLQRQSLFDSRDAAEGRCKAEAACDRLAEINSDVDLIANVVDITPGRIATALDGVDLVIDATDNFLVRFLLNDWALENGTPWVHGGCVGATGQVFLFDGAKPPCFRCLVPSVPPASAVDTCDTAGVIGSATSAIASIQATEAIKWLSGNRGAISKSVLSVDFWNNRVRQIRLAPTPDDACVACGQREFEFLRGDSVAADATLCGRNAVQISPANEAKIDLDQITGRWDGVGRVQQSRFFARLHLDGEVHLTLFRDGRIVVQGTDDITLARSMVDRYIGG